MGKRWHLSNCFISTSAVLSSCIHLAHSLYLYYTSWLFVLLFLFLYLPSLPSLDHFPIFKRSVSSVCTIHTSFFFFEIICTQISQVRETMWNASFCVWFIWFDSIISRFIHFSIYESSLCLLAAIYYAVCT